MAFHVNYEINWNDRLILLIKIFEANTQSRGFILYKANHKIDWN